MSDSVIFKKEVEKRFQRLFKASKDGYKLPDMERHRLAGFIQAGVFLNLTSNAEMQALMDAVHVSVFGQTISERQESLSITWNDEGVDYSHFDQPTFERKQDGHD